MLEETTTKPPYMTTIDKIITAVEKKLCISKEALITSKDRRVSDAQRVLCHTARAMDITYQELADATGMPIRMIYKRNFIAQILVDERDNQFISLLDAVRAKLKLPPVVSKTDGDVSRMLKTYTPFVNWTSKEEYLMQRACDASAEFMKSYGKGVAPKYVGR